MTTITWTLLIIGSYNANQGVAMTSIKIENMTEVSCRAAKEDLKDHGTASLFISCIKVERN